LDVGIHPGEDDALQKLSCQATIWEKNFEILSIVEFFSTSKCESPNILLKLQGESEFYFSRI